MEDLISLVVIKQILTTVFNRNIWYTFESCRLRFKTMQKILTSKTGGKSSAGGQTSDGQARGGGTSGSSTQGDEGETNTGSCAQADGGEDSGDLQKNGGKINYYSCTVGGKFYGRKYVAKIFVVKLHCYIVII